MRTRVVAVIPSAGRGNRFGAGLPKQFVVLAGKPLLAYTLAVFQQSPDIQEIVVVAPADSLGRVRDEVIGPYRLTKVTRVIVGGQRRQDSVRMGLQALEPHWDLVVIHDGVRPFVTPEIIARSIEAARTCGATTAAVPVIDTIKQVDTAGRVSRTFDRRRLWAIQTPQTFRFDLIQQAHRRAHRAGYAETDDAALVERLGHPVYVVESTYDNIKVTTRRDLILAEAMIADRLRQPG
jgi:2-C-methyl-D-erythritol 4-phosphate cytidylyltransferase